jgi:hypothetical protein
MMGEAAAKPGLCRGCGYRSFDRHQARLQLMSAHGGGTQDDVDWCSPWTASL